MISAEEAFEKSKVALDPLSTIDEMLEIAKTIEDAASKGCFGVYSSPMFGLKAEKLAMELEEFGYFTQVLPAAIQNEKGERLAIISVGWRWKPSELSRVVQPTNIG
jgi:hypothetical protein